MADEREESRFHRIWDGTVPDKSDEASAMWAFGYVSASAVLLSLLPLAINLSGSQDRPLTVGAGFLVGFVIFSSLIRRLHKTSRSKELSIPQVFERCRSRHVGLRHVVGPLMLTCVAGLSYVAFSWSTYFLDTAVSAALYEIWPMLWFIVMQYIDKFRFGPHDRIVASWPTYGLLFMGFPAIALIVFSSGTAQEPDSSISLSIAGVLLALIAPITGALVAANLMFVDRVMYGASAAGRDDWKIAEVTHFKVPEIEESISIVGMIFTHIVVTIVAMPLAVNEVGGLSAIISKAFLGGICAGCIGSVAGLLLRRAHLVSNERKMISVQYLSPLLALLWLYQFVGIGIGQIDLLIFGTVTIVSINMLLNSDPENKEESIAGGRGSIKASRLTTEGVAASTHSGPAVRIQPRHGLRALVVSLLYFGMFVYFRKDIFGSYEFGWDGSNYWAILTLASTVFALLYAFKLTRVESSKLDEDYRTLDLVRRIELLPQEVLEGNRQSSLRDILFSIRELNRAHKINDYRAVYFEVHQLFQGIGERITSGQLEVDGDTQREISKIRSELDTLAHGRQNARGFAEKVALWLIGSIIVTFSLFVPPNHSEVALLLTDMFAILLGSVVVFLLVHLSDVGRSRADALLVERDPKKDDQPDGLFVRFRDEADVMGRRIFAAVIIVSIVFTIVCLLASDRLSL